MFEKVPLPMMPMPPSMAIDLAGDVLDLLAHQEGGHVGEFAVAADPAHRIARLVAVVVAVLGGLSRAQAPSVGKGPGAMALRRMPWRAHSTARLCVMTATPAFDMAEGTMNGPPFHTQVVRMLTTQALRFSAIQRLPQALVM